MRRCCNARRDPINSACHPPTARPGNLKDRHFGRSTGAIQRRQKEGPDYYRGTRHNHAHHHGPGQMLGTKVLSPRGMRVLLFLFVLALVDGTDRLRGSYRLLIPGAP
jgi:hypothetical protein